MPNTKVKNKENKNLKQFDFILCITVFLLLALGIVMVLSASAPTALSEDGNSYSYAIRQSGFAIVGIVCMFIISKIDYKIYKRFYKVAYIVAIAALFLVVIPHIGIERNGARRWANLGFGQFQPSEIAKIALIVFYAGYLTDHRNELNTFKGGFLKPIILLGIPILILYKVQNHLSASIIIVMVVSIMMLMAGTRLKDFISGGITFGSIAAAVMLFMSQIKGGGESGEGSFRMARILSFLDPWADASKTGWQVVQGLYAIGSGGLFGVGLGNSKQKYLYIPEPHNDFIFAVLAEELGFVGCLVVIALYGVFIWRGILTSMKAKDCFGSLLAVGITSLIGIQAIMNIAVVTSSMPATGISLPFFSYGGTSLLILLCCVGVLLNISRSTTKV